ncbi:MAG: hypothetical protein ACRD2O_10430 [Terriglobia bacterium]
MEESENACKFEDLSHRAARRVVQRAFVLTGRDRALRDHIRTTKVETLWRIEDWRFSWTVVIDLGRVEFSRKPSKRPDAAFIWPEVAGFARQIEGPTPRPGSDAEFIHAQDPKVRKVALALYSTFIPFLRQVLSDPFDENGIPLIAQNA